MTEEEEIIEEEEYIMEEEVAEEEEPENQETWYRNAKRDPESDEGIDNFLQVFNYEGEDDQPRLKGKASVHLLRYFCKVPEEKDNFLAIFESCYSFAKEDNLKIDRFNNVLQFIMNFADASIKPAFIECACNLLDPNDKRFEKWALNLQLQRIDDVIAKQQNADDLIEHTSQYIVESPTSDYDLLQQSLRLATIKLERAVTNENEADIVKFKQILEPFIDPKNTSSRQLAVYKFAQAIIALKKNLFKEACKSYCESLNEYINAYSDTKKKVLNFVHLTAMLCQEIPEVLSRPDIYSFYRDPECYRLTELFEQYKKNDFTGFKQRLPDCKAVFPGEPYGTYFKKIQYSVLKENLVTIVQKYSKVEIKYLVLDTYTENEKQELAKLSKKEQDERLAEDQKVITNYLYDHILSKKINASLDLVNMIVVTEENRKSKYLSTIEPANKTGQSSSILSTLELMANKMYASTKLKIKKPAPVNKNDMFTVSAY